MRNCIIFLFLSVIPYYVNSQSYTVSGYITDAVNGEPLLSATVFDTLSARGSETNNYGYYSITLPAGEVSINYSYVGYHNEEHTFLLNGDTILHIDLDLSNMLEEVMVIGNHSSSGVGKTQMSAVEIPVTQIKNIPSLFGENDMIKVLQLLPGVQSGTEGSAGLYVRGGGPDQNLLLLDGVPLYNVNHMLGFFSVFNSDALKNVTLYKGSFPARFGGKLSSVVDVHMKDGDDKKIRGSVGVGLISLKLQLEGPIIKEKTTFNVSLRRTYFDLLLKPFILANSGSGGINNAGYYFYDMNAKITHKVSDKDKLYLSLYRGIDAIYYGNSKPNMNVNWDWGNAIAALRWNRNLNNKLFMNTTASFTRYRSSLGSSQGDEESGLTYKSGIRDWTLKSDFDYKPTTGHDVKFGTAYTYHTFTPDVTSMKFQGGNIVEQPLDTVLGSPRVFAHETAAYFEDNFPVNRLLKINLGLHFSSFHVQNRNYYSLQPRISTRFLLSDDLSIKAGYAYMNQYTHMLSTSTVSFPTDLWVPSTKNIPPMQSHQYVVGFFYSLKNIANFSIESYYKTMNNLLEYKEGASFMGTSANWEDKVSIGRGVAYGVEFLAQRSFGNTTGWIGYTWSKADRIFERLGNVLNYGHSFPAKYDRRHDINITALHKFSEKIDVSASWVFTTGNTATLSSHEYRAADSPTYDQNFWDPNTYPYINSRNNFRYPNYHRLDLGINFHKETSRGNHRTWNISIYNAYNRMNPFYVSVWEENGKKVLKQATLFTIIPSISYNIQF